MPTSAAPARSVAELRRSIAERQARLSRDVLELKRDANPVYWARKSVRRVRVIRLLETAGVVAAGAVAFLVVHRIRARHQ